MSRNRVAVAITVGIALFFIGLAWVQVSMNWNTFDRRSVPPGTITETSSDDPGESLSGSEEPAERDAMEDAIIGDITKLDLINLAFMVTGILGKVAYDSLKQPVGIRKSLATLMVALLVSPVVYAAVYQQFNSQTLSLQGIGVAFQNGFFWQTVFTDVGKTTQNAT